MAAGSKARHHLAPSDDPRPRQCSHQPNQLYLGEQRTRKLFAQAARTMGTARGPAPTKEVLAGSAARAKNTPSRSLCPLRMTTLRAGADRLDAKLRLNTAPQKQRQRALMPAIAVRALTIRNRRVL